MTGDWSDPRWNQLYGGSSPAQPPQPQPAGVPIEPIHYLDALRELASNGQPLQSITLADLDD